MHGRQNIKICDAGCESALNFIQNNDNVFLFGRPSSGLRYKNSENKLQCSTYEA